MSATQTTTTTTTREWKDEKKKPQKLAKAYKAQVNKAKASAKPKQRRCPTCGRPI